MLKDKIRHKVAAGILALGILGGAGVTQVAFAEPAQAGTMSQCRILDAGPGRQIGFSGYRYAIYCYTNYDWFEETFLGYRDGWGIKNYGHDRYLLCRVWKCINP